MEKCREAREEHFHHRTCLADDEHVDTFKGKHRLQVMLFDVFWVSAHQLDMDVKSMVVAMNCCEYSGPILGLCSETRSETSSAPSSCFSVGQAHWGSKVQKLAKQSISAVTLKSHCCCDGLTFSGACKSCKSHCSLVLLSGGRLVLCLVRQWHCGMSSMKYNMSIYKLSICIYIYISILSMICIWHLWVSADENRGRFGSAAEDISALSTAEECSLVSLWSGNREDVGKGRSRRM